MVNYPYELAQDAAYQSHTGRLTGLWFLPKLAQGPNTNNNKIRNLCCLIESNLVNIMLHQKSTVLLEK
jgi:hypothetical protein